LYQTAVPGGQVVGIFLERVGQLGAGQLLNIEIAVAVGVGFEFDLSKSRSGDNKNRAAQHEFFRDHWTLLSGVRRTCGKKWGSMVARAALLSRTPYRQTVAIRP
jgi:hypothetical protein